MGISHSQGHRIGLGRANRVIPIQPWDFLSHALLPLPLDGFSSSSPSWLVISNSYINISTSKVSHVIQEKKKVFNIINKKLVNA